MLFCHWYYTTFPCQILNLLKKEGYVCSSKERGTFSTKCSMLLATRPHQSRAALSPAQPGAALLPDRISRPQPRPHSPLTPQPWPPPPPLANSRLPWPTAASYTSPCHRGHLAWPTQPLPRSANAAPTLAHLVWLSADTLAQSRPPMCGLVHVANFFLKLSPICHRNFYDKF